MNARIHWRVLAWRRSNPSDVGSNACGTRNPVENHRCGLHSVNPKSSGQRSFPRTDYPFRQWVGTMISAPIEDTIAFRPALLKPKPNMSRTK